RQFFEWNIDIDLFPCAGSKQIFLRLAKLGTTKNAHHALFDAKTAIWNRLVQIDCDGSTKTSTLRTCTEWIVETEKPGCRRANVEGAVGAMPAGGERGLVVSSTVEVGRGAVWG